MCGLDPLQILQLFGMQLLALGSASGVELRLDEQIHLTFSCFSPRLIFDTIPGPVTCSGLPAVSTAAFLLSALSL
jgi:hypothetical protein